MSEKAYDAVVAGHVCLDIIPELSHPGGTVEQVFVPGKLLNIESTAFCTGGAVSNVGIPLIKLGIHTGLMGKIGNDAFGSGIRSINRGAPVTSGSPPTMSKISAARTGSRRASSHRLELSIS